MGVISINLSQEVEEWLDRHTDNKSAFVNRVLRRTIRNNPDFIERKIKRHKEEIERHKKRIEELEEKLERIQEKKRKRRKRERREIEKRKEREMRKMKEWIKDFESEKTDKKIKRIRRENREKIEEYGSREKFVNAEGGKVYQKFLNKWGEELSVSPGMVDKYLKYIEKVKGE